MGKYISSQGKMSLIAISVSSYFKIFINILKFGEEHTLKNYS